ncbi:MAG: hypothetical protein FWE37_00990 [Spirochaetaceae bacterium]|nr:hypothetical protein [Spirochaetaceae bacterium]
MKKIILLLAAALFIVSCGNDNTVEVYVPPAADESFVTPVTPIAEIPAAVVIQQDTLLFRGVNANGGLINGLALPIGSTVILDEETPPHSNGHVRASDLASGESGFISPHAILRHGVLAVVNIPNVALRQNPDNIRIADATIPAMAIVGIVPNSERNGFVEVKYMSHFWLRVQNHFINLNDVSLNPTDITLATLYYLALNERNPTLRDRYMNEALALANENLFSAAYIFAFHEFLQRPVFNPIAANTASLRERSATTFFAEPNPYSLQLATIFTPILPTSLANLNLVEELADFQGNIWVRDANFGFVPASNINLTFTAPPPAPAPVAAPQPEVTAADDDAPIREE